MSRQRCNSALNQVPVPSARAKRLEGVSIDEIDRGDMAVTISPSSKFGALREALHPWRLVYESFDLNHERTDIGRADAIPEAEQNHVADHAAASIADVFEGRPHISASGRATRGVTSGVASAYAAISPLRANQTPGWLFA